MKLPPGDLWPITFMMIVFFIVFIGTMVALTIAEVIK